jgi:hypothetical protein
MTASLYLPSPTRPSVGPVTMPPLANAWKPPEAMPPLANFNGVAKELAHPAAPVSMAEDVPALKPLLNPPAAAPSPGSTALKRDWNP